MMMKHYFFGHAPGKYIFNEINDYCHIHYHHPDIFRYLLSQYKTPVTNTTPDIA